jgi:hypothetical protein
MDLRTATDAEWFAFVRANNPTTMLTAWLASVPHTTTEWEQLPTPTLRRLVVLGMLLGDANLIDPTTLYGGPEWIPNNAIRQT